MAAAHWRALGGWDIDQVRDKRLEEVVYNNAVWCDTICRTHGKPGEFVDGIWFNRYETPPFYPNVVTLKDDRIDNQTACINDLIVMGIPGEWGVKDSFCTLDLMPVGFDKVFEGEWIYREGLSLESKGHNLAGVSWVRISREWELAHWEKQWRGESTDEVENQERVFLPSLLTEEDVLIVAAMKNQEIVAGLIASCTGDVIGVSNIFVPESDGMDFRAGCITAVSKAFPGLPMVGYESGMDLGAMELLGFEGIGPLRIWVKES